MWLPETAVDLETLEVLAAEGVAFTILAPHQAGRVRPLLPRRGRGEKGERGREAKEGLLPGRMSTAARSTPGCPTSAGSLRDGQIVLFFYDGPISRDVAFEGLLNNGEDFARRLTGGFAEKDQPQIVHIATDGETYGHHHRFGDMALAFCLQHIEAERPGRGHHLRGVP